MNHELAKAYEPREVEDRIVCILALRRIFSRKTRSGEKTIHHCNSAAQYYRTAAHGTRHGRNAAGHPDPLAPDAGLRCACGFRARTMLPLRQKPKSWRAMREEGITKEDLGRDGFLERAWKWKAQYGGRIVEQLKKLGMLLRLGHGSALRLDEGCSRAVQRGVCAPV